MTYLCGLEHHINGDGEAVTCRSPAVTFYDLRRVFSSTEVQLVSRIVQRCASHRPSPSWAGIAEIPVEEFVVLSVMES